MDLSIYKVYHGGEHFEAQVFEKRRLPMKVYLSRKRRIQRLKRSANFIDDIDWDNARIIISRIPFDGIERHQKGQLVASEVETSHDLSASSYPPLCSSHVKSVESPNWNVWSGGTRPSFAEAASLHRV